MRFRCGDKYEKKALKLLKEWEKRENGYSYKKFAWLPIKVGEETCRWLEFVLVVESFDEERLRWLERARLYIEEKNWSSAAYWLSHWDLLMKKQYLPWS